MNIRAWLQLTVLLLASVFIAMPKAHAGVGRDRATGQAVWDAAVNGRTTNIGGAGGVWKVIGPAGSATAGSAAGSAKISGSGKAPVAGKEVPVNMTGEIAKDAIVGGLQGCLTGSLAGCVLGTLTPLAIGYMSLSGLRQSPTDGSPEIMPSGDAYCYTGPCYQYRVISIITSAWTRSYADACAQYVAAKNPGDSTYTWSYVGFTAPNVCRLKAVNKSTGVVQNPDWPWSVLERQSATVMSPTWYPATPQDVRDALYKNDPPVGVVDELARYGNIIWPLGTTTVTGPASIDGPKRETVNPDGSKRIEQDRTNYSYDGPNVTRTGTTTTTTTVAPDGTTTSTSTTTTTESAADVDAKDPASEDSPPTDTDLPPVPDLYTRKYPDGMEGIWNEAKQQLASSPLMTLKDQLMPTLPSSGTCPTFMIPADLAAWAPYGSLDVSPPCWVWDFGRLVTLIGAFLLARALIFGG